MDYSDRWCIIGELGEGGQGKVYRVIDSTRFDIEKEIKPAIKKAIITMGAATTKENLEKHFELFRKAIIDLVQIENPLNHGALKVLHKPQDARDASKAEVRIKHEIQAMSDISHPNLLKILDIDPNSKWFVSQFYSKGTLGNNLGVFAGDFAKALRAFRRLVEGVAELHKKKLVHRDIKPQNIFLDYNGNLVLGDFGLVFFTDERHTRITDTWENVGSRDWMPGWAMGMRIEDIRPSFDVFCLGKLLWSMVSGSPILRLWYFDKPEFNLEKKFPNNRFIKLANPLLKKCIVENEKDCFVDATELLVEVDKVLSIIENNADLLDPKVERTCKICAIGKYRLIVDRNATDMRNFGITPVGTHSMKIFTCDHCGNAQLFSFHSDKELIAWQK